MPLSPDDEAQGLKAYEQALAFQRLQSWRLPVTLTIFPLCALAVGFWTWALGLHLLALANFGIGVFLAWMGRFQWKQLRARHARNLRLLARLEEEHGAALPWRQVESHFAALEKLKRELAEDSHG